MVAFSQGNRPDFRLVVAGKDITAAARPRLVSLTLGEKRGGEADQLQIVLDDSDGKLELPKKGATIVLRLGWASGADVTPGLIDKGRFLVDEVSWSGPPDHVDIRARSADLTAAFRVRKEAGHKSTTLGALAKKVAAAHGLESKVDSTLAGIAVPVIAQHHQSDMALLRRLGEEHDAVATVKDGKLILTPIGKGMSAGGKALPAIRLTRADVSDYSYRELDRSGDAGVEARWHDLDSGERKTAKAEGSGKGKPRRLRRVYHSEAEAMAAAKAENGRAQRAEAEFQLSLPLGRADLYPERPVTLSGFKAPADAKKWIIAEVQHSLDSGGFKTRLTLELKP